MRSRSLAAVFALVALLILAVAGWWMLRGDEAPAGSRAAGDSAAAEDDAPLPPPLPVAPSVVADQGAAGGTGEPPVESGGGSVTGRVLHVTALDPAPGIRVVLQGTIEPPVEIASAVTDENGAFVFRGIPAGTWAFKTLSPGVPVPDLEHEPVAVKDGEKSVVEIYVNYVVPEGEGIGVSGTVAYEDGAVPERFSLQLQNGNRSVIAHGENGRFSVRLPSAGTYDIHDVRADGVLHEYLYREVALEDGGTFALELERPERKVLVVTDRETGAPLPSARAFLRVHAPDTWQYRHHPNPETLEVEPLRADAAGRIVLEKALDEVALFVTADGHEWRSVTVPVKGEREIHVRLRPGGSARVTVPRWKELEEAGLFSVEVDQWETWVLPPPGEDGKVLVHGLPVGRREFRVQRGRWHEDGHVYGSVVVEILAGRTAEVLIDASPLEQRPDVTARFTVHIPEAWGRKKAVVELEGIEAENTGVEESESAPLDGEGNAEMEIGPLKAGRYALTIEPQFYRVLEINESSREFEFTLPQPVEVRVRIVDKATGRDVPGASLSWFATTENRRTYSHDRTRHDAKTGEHVFQAPPGVVNLFINAGGWINDPEAEGSNFWGHPLEIPAAGPVRHTVHVVRAGTVRVVVKGADEDLAAEEIEIGIRQQIGEHGWVSHGAHLEGNVGERRDIPPGKWTLKVGVPEDLYEKVPDREITVTGGRVTEVVVELRRK